MSTERPLSAVLSDIAGNVQDIVRAELRLAKTEATDEVARASSAGLMVGLGILMLGISGLFALLAAVYALSLVMPAGPGSCAPAQPLKCRQEWYL